MPDTGLPDWTGILYILTTKLFLSDEWKIKSVALQPRRRLTEVVAADDSTGGHVVSKALIPQP